MPPSRFRECRVSIQVLRKRHAGHHWLNSDNYHNSESYDSPPTVAVISKLTATLDSKGRVRPSKEQRRLILAGFERSEFGLKETPSGNEICCCSAIKRSRVSLAPSFRNSEGLSDALVRVANALGCVQDFGLIPADKGIAPLVPAGFRMLEISVRLSRSRSWKRMRTGISRLPDGI